MERGTQFEAERARVGHAEYRAVHDALRSHYPPARTGGAEDPIC